MSRRYILGCSSVEGLIEVVTLTHDSHTTSSSSEGSLDDNWQTVLLDELGAVGPVVDGAGGTGYYGHVLPDGELAGRDLVSKTIDYLGGGTDENDSVGLDLAGELSVLREETITCNPSAMAHRDGWGRLGENAHRDGSC